MTKQIEVDGQIHEFPDDATNDDISMALNGHNQTIWQDVKQSISDFPDYAKNAIKGFLPEVNEGIHQDLGRSLRNIGAGTAGLYNILPEALGYAGRKADHTQEEMNNLLKTVDFKKIFGVDKEQPGDVFWQNVGPGGLIKAGTKGLKGLQAIASRAGGVGAVAASQGEDPLHAMLLGTALEGAFKGGKGVAKGVASVARKAAYEAPIFKFMTNYPYKQNSKYMEEHGLGEDVQIDPNDLREARSLLSSKGVELPEEGIHRSFSKALAGKYNSIRAIETSLRNESRRLQKKGGIENDLGTDFRDLAEKIYNQNIQHHENIGHPEVGQNLALGKHLTARYHKLLPYRNTLGGLALAEFASPWIAKLLKANQ